MKRNKMQRPRTPKCPVRAMSLALILASAIFVFGQAPENDRITDLAQGQILTREMTGSETHRYKFELKKDEFFQVRAEQKGVDVALKLVDAGGKVLAAMDSPNGKEGPEILTWVANGPGAFVLEISGFDVKAEKGAYEVKREASRTGSATDKKRVEIERLFAEGISLKDVKGQEDAALGKLDQALAGWQQLNEPYLTDLASRNIRLLRGNRELIPILIGFYKELEAASLLQDEGSVLSRKSKEDSLPARAKFVEALKMFRALEDRTNDRVLVEKVTRFKEVSEEPWRQLKNIRYYMKSGETACLDGIAGTHYILGEWKEEIEFLKLAVGGYGALATDESLNSFVSRQRVMNVRVLEAAKLNRIGDALDILGKTDESIKYLERSAEKLRSLYEETKAPENKLREAGVLNKLGIIYGKEARNIPKSIELLTRAAEIYRSLPGQRKDEGTALFLIGLQYMNSFRYGEARETLESALKIFRELDIKFYQTMALQALGGIESILGNEPRIREYADQSLMVLLSPDFTENWIRNSPDVKGFEVYGELNRNFIERSRLDGIAYSYRLLEDFQKALEYHEKVLVLTARTNEPSAKRKQFA